MTGRPPGRGWHSLVEVQPMRPIEGMPDDAAGAFVHILALAHDPDHFKELVSERLYAEGFAVIGWDAIQPFDLDKNDWHQEEAAALHDRLQTSDPVQYSHFDTYSKDGLNG